MSFTTVAEARRNREAIEQIEWPTFAAAIAHAIRIATPGNWVDVWHGFDYLGTVHRSGQIDWSPKVSKIEQNILLETLDSSR